MSLTSGRYFSTDVTKNGIFNTYLSLITYDCSPAYVGKCSNVFNGDTSFQAKNYWSSSPDDADPYYQVELKRGYFYPDNGALFSCNANNCLMNFSIYGLRKGEEEFEKICSYTVKESQEFLGTMKSFPCAYDRPLKAIKLKNNGPNSSGTNQIALYAFDFYGFISFGSCTFHQHFHLKLSFHFLFVLWE